ncbi:PREDICTED: beta-glucosidase 1 isoform X3 [Camelina sativa]|uniref:beta-glucosidase n=1 Tax=Camelina sativa TaxID=90675 RepID=A0ABM1RK58_CAMSA|nr:PREDICTED: beta-glucosidase 1 isoform X3 [Camelina sativa]
MDNGDIACDGYHKYKEDVKLMAETGLRAFRFSISWSRLILNGRGSINPKGLQFYKNFIQELVRHGIEPHVTLYHYDHPQYLEDDYGGWINRRIIKDFTAYADVCFREFGRYVKFWTTINEANIFTIGGYNDGNSPPGRCSFPGRNCLLGNSSTETYIVGHNLLLAHASVSRLFKQKYKDIQGGSVGFSLYAFDFTPSTSSKDDEIATQRANDFYLGCFFSEGQVCWFSMGYGRHPGVYKAALWQSPVYILENGKIMKQDLELQQKDTPRIEYLEAYIGAVLKAVRNGSDTRGYFVWSFMDLYELLTGYEHSYGLYSVNFSDPQRKRSPKLSALWYSGFLKGKTTFLGSQGIMQSHSNFSSSS